MFFFVALAVFASAYGYVGWRIIGTAQLAHPWNLLAWIALLSMIFLPFVPLIGRRFGRESAILDGLAWIGYTGLGLFSLVFAALLARDALWLVTLAGAKIGSWISGGTDALADPVRRRFIVNGLNLGILGGAAVLSGYGFFSSRGPLRIQQISVAIPGLPKALDGLRIAQVTDVHVGPTIKRDYVQRIVDKVNAIGADIIAFTGDLVDGSVESLGNDVAPMAQMKAPLGKFFVTGNHEYYSGVDQWVEEAERLGYRVLLNEHVPIEKDGASLILAGVTDYRAETIKPEHKSSVKKAIEAAPDNTVKILLAHQPKSVFEASELGIDLVLSGHTHGGQYVPWTYLVGLDQPYVKGLHNHNGTHIYVSNGAGYWGPPLRLQAPPEIAVITLRSGEAQTSSS